MKAEGIKPFVVVVTRMGPTLQPVHTQVSLDTETQVRNYVNNLYDPQNAKVYKITATELLSL
jgi:hypothetical protein